MKILILMMIISMSWAEIPVDRPMYEFESNLKKEIHQSLERYYQGKIQASVFLSIKSIDLNEKSSTQTVDLGYMPTPVVIKNKADKHGKMVQKIDVHAFIHHQGSESEKQDIINIIRSATSPYPTQAIVSFKVKIIEPLKAPLPVIQNKTIQEEIKEILIKDSAKIFDFFMLILTIFSVASCLILLPFISKKIISTFFENKTRSLESIKKNRNFAPERPELKPSLNLENLNSFQEIILNLPRSFRQYFLKASIQDKELLTIAYSLMSLDQIKKLKPFLHDLLVEMKETRKEELDFNMLNNWIQMTSRKIIVSDSVDRKIIEEFISQEDYVHLSNLSLEEAKEIGNKLQDHAVWSVLMLSRTPDESSSLLNGISPNIYKELLSNQELDFSALDEATKKIIQGTKHSNQKGISKISNELVHSFSLMLESKNDDEAQIILKGIKQTHQKLFDEISHHYWPVSKIATLDVNFIKKIFQPLTIEEKTLVFIGLDKSGQELILKSSDIKLQTILKDAKDMQTKTPSLEVKKQAVCAVRSFINKCKKNVEVSDSKIA